MNPIYIKKIFIEQYKSLRNSTISLENGINIIIGKNGAGKSNLLSFINQNLRSIILYSPSHYSKKIFYTTEVVRQIKGSKENIFMEVSRQRNNSNNKPTKPVNFELNYVKKIKGLEDVFFNYNSPKSIRYGTEISQLLVDLNSSIINYNTPIEIPFLNLPFNFTIDSDNYVDSDFINNKLNIITDLQYSYDDNVDYIKLFRKTKNETQFIEAIINNTNKIFEENNLISFLNNYTPIQNIKLNENINIYQKEETIIVENLKLEFLINDEWLPWNFLSDGTKRLFLLISQFTSDLSNNIFLIEEPELGIHPEQLFKLMDFLREQSLRKQIIITTHSTIVLDVLKKNELNKINICYNTPQGTRFKKLSTIQKKKAIQYMEEVGELSYYWLHSDLEDA